MPLIDEPEEKHPEVPVAPSAPVAPIAPEPSVPQIVEEPKPEVATTMAAPTMENYEIQTPEPEVPAADIANITAAPVKRTPMFVIDEMPAAPQNLEQESTPTNTSSLYNNNIAVDVPDMEEMI